VLPVIIAAVGVDVDDDRLSGPPVDVPVAVEPNERQFARSRCVVVVG
jgi:hypothetical protein